MRAAMQTKPWNHSAVSAADRRRAPVDSCVPEAYGGLGLGYVELVSLMEEMGAACCAPVLLTVPGYQSAADRCQRGTATTVPARHRRRRDHGDSAFAATARIERRVLCHHGPDPAASPRSASHVVRVPAAPLLGEEGARRAALARTLDRARVALAAEQVGGAQRCLDLGVAYAKERVQFGRPIGSFQAIKHRLAEMLVRVESARSAAYYAGWRRGARKRGARAGLASLAKAYCSEAYFACAAESASRCTAASASPGSTTSTSTSSARAPARHSSATPAWHRERVARRLAALARDGSHRPRRPGGRS